MQAEATIPYTLDENRPIYRSEHNAPLPQWDSRHADEYVPSGSSFINATSAAVAEFERTKQAIERQKEALASFQAETSRRVIDSEHSRHNYQYEHKRALEALENDIRSRHESINFGASRIPNLTNVTSHDNTTEYPMDSTAHVSRSFAPRHVGVTGDDARKVLLRYASPDLADASHLSGRSYDGGDPNSPHARGIVPQPSTAEDMQDAVTRVCNTDPALEESAEQTAILAARHGVSMVSKIEESKILYGIRRAQMGAERERARAYVRNRQYAEQQRAEQEKRASEIEEQQQWQAKTRQQLADKRKVHVLSEIERKRNDVQGQLSQSTAERRLIDTHTRFMKAMRAEFLRKLKGKQIELPPLCACGHKTFENKVPVCANNCPFYNNPELYRKTLATCLQSVEV